MASPLKPWEMQSNMNRRVEGQAGQPSVRFRLPTGSVSSKEDVSRRDSPPPIPSRQRNTENRMQPFGSSYMGNAYGMHGGYGGSYGGYGCSPYNMYNRSFGYGPNNMAPSSFARQAEDSCQPAFDSVQSVVQAFASIATMLDSTFFAVHSSFRAVLGVADQLSNLKSHITNTLGALAIFKAIRYIYRKMMVWLRLRDGDVGSFQTEAWGDASRDVAEEQFKKKASKSWPVVLFFAVVLGTPWLIWKLLQTLSGEGEAETWMTGQSEHFEAEAEYDFDAENEDEISFQTGDVLRVAPKHKQPHVRGWLLASIDGKAAGLVPANYIKIFGKKHRTGRKMHEKGNEPINQEIHETNYEQSNDFNNTKMDSNLEETYEKEFQET